ncbi:MAG: hypothetical protein OXH09_04310 [Gammaproteobacteria bacterium]|nr:hypothetical protein [Gammaproteobacteria bacterium]
MTKFELPRANPDEVGMSGERLEKVGDVVREFIDEGRIQYAVVGVARRGKVVYFEAQRRRPAGRGWPAVR